MTRDLAEAFLEALSGSAATPVSWQTFTDRKPSPPPSRWRDTLARVLHGTLAEHADELVCLNEAGAGIFATVNETNLRGRSASDVVAVRALFCDVDGAEPELLVPASFFTVTARGRNPFWRLRPGEPVCRFREGQARLAATYGTDATVRDLSRVMRVPGFFHRKADPLLVGFAPGNGRKWTIDELLELHPPVAVAPKRPAVAPGGSIRLSVAGRGREGALLSIVAQKAAERPWTVGCRHASAVETATHARKLGLGPAATRDLVANLLVAAGKAEDEAGDVVAWVWENVSPDPKELEERPPEAVAVRQLRQGVDPETVVGRLRRWHGLSAQAATSIVEKVSAARPRQIGDCT